MKRVVPVLGLFQENSYLLLSLSDCEQDLHKDILDKLDVGTVVEEVPHDIAEEDHLSRAVGEPKHALVLSTEGDQVLHGRTEAGE